MSILGPLRPKKLEKTAAQLAEQDLNELVDQVNILGYRIREKALDKDERLEIVNDLFGKLKGQIKSIAYKHKGALAVQACYKYCTEKQRDQITDELGSELPELCKKKYAVHLVLRLLIFSSPEQRKRIADTIINKTHNLATHTVGSTIIEALYREFATPEQKTRILQSLYGRTYAAFAKSDNADLDHIDDKVKKNMTQFLSKLTAKLQDKQLLRHSFVHDLLAKYEQVIDDKSELYKFNLTNALYLLHTKQGLNLVIRSLAHGSTKDKKKFVKLVGEHAENILTSKVGHTAIAAIFNIVDDTVIVQKYVLKPILANLESVMSDKYSRQVLLHLFDPNLAIKGVKIDTSLSKKSVKDKHAELVEFAHTKIAKFLLDNQDAYADNTQVAQLVSAVTEQKTGSRIKTKGEEISNLAKKKRRVTFAE